MDKTLLLAVETSSRIGSVALGRGNEPLMEASFSAPLKHTSELFPAVQGLLDRIGGQPTDIGQVYLSIGPGSFTGIRIAVAMAKAMHLAGAVKIVTIDTLDTIAANVPLAPDGPQTLAALLDAKRNRFFVAGYRRDLTKKKPVWAKVLDDSLLTAHQVLDWCLQQARPVHLLGDGLLYYRERLDAEGVVILDQGLWSPKAANVYRMGYKKAIEGRFEDPLRLAPLYLIPPEVTIKRP